MNLFEKIFNYQILSKLEDSGTFMVTAHERGWLKAMLRHPAAAEAFSPETLQKLQLMLEQDLALDTGELQHKAASKEKHAYHPNVRPLRQAITNKSMLRLSYSINNERTHIEQECFPYKLEYSMVKREWYLLWYHAKNRMLMSTKLDKIIAIGEQACGAEYYEQLRAKVYALQEKRSISADIRVMPEYNGELSRILYAFSCFEKEVSYEADTNAYTIRLFFSSGESEYVLSKTRFLGKRVNIINNKQLRSRMLESATKALGRYEE